MPECLHPEEKFGNEMIVVSEELLWFVDKKLSNGKIQRAPMGESNDNKGEKLQSGALRLVPSGKHMRMLTVFPSTVQTRFIVFSFCSVIIHRSSASLGVITPMVHCVGSLAAIFSGLLIASNGVLAISRTSGKLCCCFSSATMNKVPLDM